MGRRRLARAAPGSEGAAPCTIVPPAHGGCSSEAQSPRQGETFVEILGDGLFEMSAGDMMIDENIPENAVNNGPQELIRGLPDDLVRQWILPRANPASYGQMKRVSRGWRSLIEEGELFRLRKEQGLTAEMLCVTYEGQGWEFYNPREDSWSFMEWEAETLKKTAKHRCVGVGSKLYHLGGQLAGSIRKDVYVYDLERARWSRVHPMSSPRADFACCTDGARLWVAGGSLTYYSRDGEMYHPEDDTWVPLPSLVDRHFGTMGNRHLQGLWIRDRFLVEPGHVVFNPEASTWTFPPNPDAGAESPYMVANVGGELYGARHAPGDDNRHVRIDWFDVDTAVPSGSVSKDFIRKRKAAAPPTKNCSRYKFGMAGLNGRLYVFGGKVKAGLPGKRRRRKDVSTVEVYNPMPTKDEPEWKAVKAMGRTKGEIKSWTTVVA